MRAPLFRRNTGRKTEAWLNLMLECYMQVWQEVLGDQGRHTLARADKEEAVMRAALDRR